DPGLTGVTAWLATAALIVLGTTVLLQPLAERYLEPRHARLVIWPASLWIGFAFFLALSLGVSEILVGVLGAARPGGDPQRAAAVRATLVLATTAVVGGLALANGLRRPRTTRVEITLDRWPRELDGFRIVQSSDIHIGAMRDRRFAAEGRARVQRPQSALT